jgi:hypothetical protein
MRSDMHKVIVERPRRLGDPWSTTRFERKTGKRFVTADVSRATAEGDAYDSGSTRAPISRHDKELNENLAPLRRFLHAQAGRPWNKVYAEIAQTIDRRSAIGLHVLQHLTDFVDLHPDQEHRFYRHTDLFVDPATGILRKHKQRRRPRYGTADPKPSNVASNLPIHETLLYRKRRVGDQDLWFRVDFRQASPGELIALPDGRDAVAETLPRSQQLIAVAERQCDRKTIRWIEQEFAQRARAARIACARRKRK